MMGSALAYDLAHSPGVEKIILADINLERATRVARGLETKTVARQLDINNFADVVKLMKTVDVAVGATSYTHNLSLTKAAIEAGIHFCDLGGNMDIVDRQMALNADAK